VAVEFSVPLLRWYDAHARELPWRAVQSERADPYRVWLSEIMLQQTTVAAVRPYFERFTTRWPTVSALAAADGGELMAAWAGLGYYARARNLLACARRVVAEHGGRFPDREEALRSLPGIGRYTAAAIAAIAHARRAVVVDGNVERVVSRLHAVEQPLPASRPALYRLADALTPAERPGDYAQAMMDLGATICTPRSPRCHACPVSLHCRAFQLGQPETYPRKLARTPKPQRQGRTYWLEHGEDVLLVRRPNRGLLGGMLALPTGSWSEDLVADGAPAAARWRDAGAVAHVFTHFALHLEVACARAEDRTSEGVWWPIATLAQAGLPTVFAKAAERAIEWRLQAPLPLREREGPKPQAWEGEGPAYPACAETLTLPPCSAGRAPPSPPGGEGL
jgi:A/G-specific adenine glycosylase